MNTVKLASSDHFRVCDAFELPNDGQTVVAAAQRRQTYAIEVTRTLGETLGHLAGLVGDASVAIITDETVGALYGDAFVQALRAGGADVQLGTIPAGEASKSLRQAVRLWHWLADSTIARRDVVIALGGGVVNDLGGWVASAYMRGLSYINVPTTLLAQVDGAIGGKVAVNHPVAKNLIGAFHQPAGVVADISLLRSLDRRHMRAGIAETVKKAVIASPAYFEFIDGHAEALVEGDEDTLARLVRAAAAIKAAMIERDPYERDLRRPLNFGHTIAHPLETVSGYGPLLHGEAVAFGMVVESRIAAARGLLDAALLDRLISLLRRCGLPTRADELPAGMDATAVCGAMEKVRLIRAGSLRFALPVVVGETLIVDDVDGREVRRALEACGMS